MGFLSGVHCLLPFGIIILTVFPNIEGMEDKGDVFILENPVGTCPTTAGMKTVAKQQEVCYAASYGARFWTMNSATHHYTD
jgi:hypothetical protein